MKNNREAIYASIFTFMCIVIPLCVEQQTAELNGTPWVRLSRSAKLNFASGYVEGYVQAYKEMADSALSKHIVSKESSPPVGDLFDVEVQHFRADNTTPSIGEIVQGVDLFYRESANVSVCVHNAVDSEWLALSGNPVSQQALDAIRSRDGQNGCP